MTLSGGSVSAEQMIREGAIQLAVHKADLDPDMIVPGSRERKCSRCDVLVLISPGAFPLADRLAIVCSHCWTEAIEHEDLRRGRS